MSDQAMLDRFHHALASIIENERPGGLSRPVTVAELYQDLASYPRMRELIGLEMHADYEQTLVRLLAGDEGRVRLEPDTARDELRQEMESEDPNLSIYRRFAACEVHVSPPPHARADPHSATAAFDTAPAMPAAPATPAAPAAAPLGTAAHIPEASARRHPDDAVLAQATEACVFCAEPLPEHREVRFCPRCGGDQRLRPCASCGETIEPGWLFCVSCGAALPGA